jgi:acyl-CoA thioester hydrolase
MCKFYHLIEVRYGDLDPQGHVNNAKYLTYFEQARVAYLQHLGLWDGKSFLDVGMILADVKVTFRAPVRFGQELRVGVQVTRLGGKSFTTTYCLEDAHTHKELATGAATLVAYDYRARESISIPEVWRHAIATFENIPPTAEKLDS